MVWVGAVLDGEVCVGGGVGWSCLGGALLGGEVLEGVVLGAAVCQHKNTYAFYFSLIILLQVC